MPTQKELDYQIINDFAGHLQDAAYSLLALPSASRFNRFMIVLDLSFFCNIERGKPIDETEFKAFMRTMFQPFITTDWVRSFEFYDEQRVKEAAEKGKNEIPELPRFDAFVDNFSASWYRIFRSLDFLIEEHRPIRRLPTMTRARDTELSEDAMNAIGAAVTNIHELQTLVHTALPPAWSVIQRVGNKDETKFILYRTEIKVFESDKRTSAYIMVYLPSRMMRGLPDLRKTFV